ncbi:MAG TPA: methyltransferase domain-containing protein [Nitrospira sp.]|nr:methyltransferase domain-containing protein [Nitrospira sp.]
MWPSSDDPARPPRARRLHVGCGPCASPGWINLDRVRHPGVQVACDLAAGVPLRSESCDCAVAIHVLQDLPYAEVVPVLAELRRVLKPGGVLRLGLPDLDKAIAAYCRNDHAYFYVPDSDALDIGAKLVTQATWYGSVRTPMTYGFARECLERAGFTSVQRCTFGTTRWHDRDIVQLDNRERESLFLEARR